MSWMLRWLGRLLGRDERTYVSGHITPLTGRDFRREGGQMRYTPSGGYTTPPRSEAGAGGDAEMVVATASDTTLDALAAQAYMRHYGQDAHECRECPPRYDGFTDGLTVEDEIRVESVSEQGGTQWEAQ